MIATIILGGILSIIVALVVHNLVQKARSGGGIGCECGCATCPISSSCTAGVPAPSGLIQIQVPERRRAEVRPTNVA